MGHLARLFRRDRPALRRRAILGVESLETRLAPAVRLNATTLAYTDADGDRARVVLSKPLLTDDNVDDVFGFDTPFEDRGPQQLQNVNLSVLGQAAQDLVLTVRAEAGENGDGQAHVGHIDTERQRLARITLDGDLGRFVGDRVTGLLRVQSLGRLGLTTQGGSGALGISAARIANLGVAGDVHGSIGAARLGTVAVGGSLVGGDTEFIGTIFTGRLDALRVGGDLQGGAGSLSGAILCTGPLGTVTVRGSLLGGAGEGSAIISGLTVGTVTVVGDLLGDSGEGSAGIFSSGRIAAVYVGGNVIDGGGFRSGSVLAGTTLGTLHVGGNLDGTVAAAGADPDEGTKDLAIGRVTVGGDVASARILAGYDVDLLPVNADAQIGVLRVQGDWIASQAAAGVVPGLFGPAGDRLVDEEGDLPTIASRIRKVVVGGALVGTATPGGHFGFFAQQIGQLQVGGVTVALTPGAGNDEIALLPDSTNDVVLHEV